MDDKKFIIGAAILSVLAMIPFYGIFVSGEISEHKKSRDAKKNTAENEIAESQEFRRAAKERERQAIIDSDRGGSKTKRDKRKRQTIRK